ncbi:hypothetical protein METMT2_0949 [Methanothermobacter sp. MT-2]|nr:hypothetical protein METMT2_0949 [Methanothermobacter sp. MT-2]
MWVNGVINRSITSDANNIIPIIMNIMPVMVKRFILTLFSDSFFAGILWDNIYESLRKYKITGEVNGI